MALSKPILHHLRRRLAPTPTPILFPRHLSFATPEEAAADRRRRKRRLRIEPPLAALRPSPPPSPRPAPPNPNTPKLPDSAAVLAGPRLTLHNKILALIRDNDLAEASLLVRHSIYSNCRPTVFTCNAALAALLRQARYADFLTLHRFITQAGVVPNVGTYNLLISAYCDARKTDIALDHYKILVNDSPCSPSPTTYRILVKALAFSGDESKLARAVSLKDEMLSSGLGLGPDPIVYDHLIAGMVKSGDPDQALQLYSEFKDKLAASDEERGPFVIPDEVIRVYGSLMKAYFKKGMEIEAMECYQAVFNGDASSRYKIDAVGYNSVLDALSKNGKEEEVLQLFDKMMSTHDPPRRLAVNMGSFNVMVDFYCGVGKFEEAIGVFRRMGEKRCSPDTLSYNNLIEQLCGAGMVSEAEGLYREMGGEKSPSADEFTYVLLIDACFGKGRVDDADGYFKKMMEAELRPNLTVFNKVIGGLVEGGKAERVKEVFDVMVENNLKADGTTYDLLFKGLSGEGKLDELLKVVAHILKEDEDGFTAELKEFVRECLSKEGREEDLMRVIEEREKEKEREKEEALAKEAELAKPKPPPPKPKLNIDFSIFGLKKGTDASAENGDENVPAAEVVSGEESTGSDELVLPQGLEDSENLKDGRSNFVKY